MWISWRLWAINCRETSRRNFAVANETSVENIFTVPMDPVAYPDAKDYNLVRTRHYDHATAYGQSGWNGSCATVKAMNVFKFGTADDEDPRCKLTYFTGEVTGRTERRSIRNGTDRRVPLKYEPNAPKVYMDASDGLLVKTAGARMAKYEFDQNAQDGGNLHGNDCVIFRFAGALLMKAEAKIRLGQNGDDEVNQVRNRVGAKPLQNVTLDTLLDERMLELALGRRTPAGFDPFRQVYRGYGRPLCRRETFRQLAGLSRG